MEFFLKQLALFCKHSLYEIPHAKHLLEYPSAGRSIIQGEHKVFPWLQTFITKKKLMYVEHKHIFFNVTQEFFTTH